MGAKGRDDVAGDGGEVGAGAERMGESVIGERTLVCGSRGWPDIERVYRELDSLLPVAVIHGACPTGADDAADLWAKSSGVPVDRFHADWKRLGKSAGPVRNAKMLREGEPGCGLAFGPLYRETNIRTADGKDPRNSGWPKTGTGDMVSKMLRAGLPVRWVASPAAPAVYLTEMPGPGGKVGGG